MQIYCGTDIIEVERIKEAIEKTKGFKESIYSKNEIESIDKVKGNMKYQRFAGRFAAKEAIYKAISKILIENKIDMSFLDVEIINECDLKRRPKVIFLNSNLNTLCNKINLEIDISISHVEKNAIATAIVKID